MSVNVVEGLAQAFTALTGMEAVSLGSRIMINNSGTWASVGTDTVYNIVKASGAKAVGATTSFARNGVLGSVSGLNYEILFDVGGAQLKNTLATPAQLSNAARAALQNSGAQVGGNVLRPVTDLVVQSTGSGTELAVTTKGVLAKTAFETALVGGAAALGVTIGVGIVESNPELVTKIYNRFAGTDIDPSQIANIVENTTVWENIRDGATFLAEDFINVLKDVFIEEGVYSAASTGGENFTLNDVEIPISSLTPGWNDVPFSTMSSYSVGNIGNGTYKGQNYYSVTRAVIGIKKTTNTQRFVYVKSNTKNWKESTSGIVSHSPSYYLVSDGAWQKYSSRTNNQLSTGTFIDVEYPTKESALSEGYFDNIAALKRLEVSGSSSGGLWSNTTPSTRYNTKELPITAPVIEQESGLTPEQTAEKWFSGYEYPVITPTNPEDIGTSPKPGAKYPDSSKTLAEDYPDWDSRAIQTVEGWDDENNTLKMKKWYPVNVNTDQSTGQADAQDGSVNDDETRKKVVNMIDGAMEDNLNNNPDVEPNPSVYPTPNPEPGTDLQPVTPDPPDIDASDGEDPDPVVPILTTVATSGLAHIYNPTLAETKQLGAALWTPSLIENIKKIFVNPMDGIIGFHILYATPKTEAPEEIVLGYYGTGVQAKVVTNQYVTVDCGHVQIDEWWNDARDYEPYVDVSLYLPFIGIVPLKANDVINSWVKVKYNVDVLTGTCLAMVEIQRYNARGTLYQFVGNCAVTVPLSSGNYTAVLTSLLSVASSAVGGASIGGVGGALFGAFKGAAINASRAKLQVMQSGALGANAGAMGIRNPFLIIRRPITHDAYAYNMQYGYPAFKWVVLGSMKGYTRVRSIHLDDVTCTDEEKRMIEDALKEGVVF